ncbi:MAG TPA: hypothetical protein VLF41_00975 [Candidatus Nanoarchaeia archaeon]|nr:hypothetical protein [Candidatus Nanoarchaeia archaeon]
MDTNPITNIRKQLSVKHGKDSIRACEGQLEMITLIRFICSHDEDTCQANVCADCRAIYEAEARLKEYGASYADVMDLRRSIADADTDDRAGFLADITELAASQKPQPVEVDLRDAS